MNDLDMDIHWQDKVALIGRNGTGKTTLLKNYLMSWRLTRGHYGLGLMERLVIIVRNSRALIQMMIWSLP